MNAAFFLASGLLIVILLQIGWISLSNIFPIVSEFKKIYYILLGLVVATTIISAVQVGGPRLSLDRSYMPPAPGTREVVKAPDFIPKIDRRGEFDKPSSLPGESN